MLIAMVLSMLLSRCFTLQEYGTYSQINMAVSLAISFFLLGLPNSLNYFLARAESSRERASFLSVYFTMCTILCVIMGAVLYLCAHPIAMYFQNPLLESFSYVLLTLPWSKTIANSIANVLVVYQRPVRLLVLNVVNACISVAAVVIVQLLGRSFAEYMLLFVLGEILLTLWIYRIVWRLESKLRFKLDRSLIKEIFRFSIPIGLATLVGTLSLELDKLMIGGLYSTEMLAIYTNAGKELPLTVVAASITAVLMPVIARKVKEGKVKEAVVLWGSATKMSYLFICFAVTALVVFAPQIVTLLYSEKYLEGVGVFRVYSLVLLWRTTYFGMILNAMGNTKPILTSSVLSLLINLILNYVLYLVVGFIGPALASFISIGVPAAIQLTLTVRTTGIPLSQVMPWKQLMRYTLINLCWGVAAYWGLGKLNIGTDPGSIACCVAAGLLIAAGYYLLEKKEIKKVWKEWNENEKS